MLRSLKSWCNLEAIVKPYIKRNMSGSKIFGTDETIKCYAEGRLQVVKNNDGKEVMSNKQLYVDGSTSITELDNIIFEGRETEIQSIGYFYRNGKVDLKVVYL